MDSKTGDIRRLRSIRISVGSICLLCLASCSSPTPNSVTQYDLASDSACQASASWISSPSLPGEVASPQNNCSFHQFMYQSFLYLMQVSGEKPEIREFQTFIPSYGLFVGAGQKPTPYGSVPKPGYCSDGSSAPGHVYSNLMLQAGSHKPLLDQRRNDVYYSIRVNEAAYDMISDCKLYLKQCGLTLAPDLLSGAGVVDIPAKYPDLAFPDGSIELKASWKVLTKQELDSGAFFVSPGTVSSDGVKCEAVALGLVGLHIVSKTPSHPEFIWGTFEHRNNAPDCMNLTEQPPLGGMWTFFGSRCGIDCDTNRYAAEEATQVCRMHPWGDPSLGIFPNNADCNSSPPPDYFSCMPDVINNVIKPNTDNLRAINASMQALLSSLPKDDPNRLWANYQLVGNLWTVQGALPPSLQVQRGSLSSANSTMETYVQNGAVNQTLPNSCFSCHNLDGKTPAGAPSNSLPAQLPQAGLSHIFNLINMDTSGCQNGKLPAACSAYNTSAN